MLTVAMVASVESLLCAVATDKLHGGPRANLDKELIAQGATNLVSGMVGGLPVTGVIVRSSANVQSGAKTRWAAVFHGVWMLAFVLLLPELLRLIPGVLTKGHYFHYRGFYHNERKQYDRSEPRSIKKLLYAYRVLMTGCVLLREQVVEANLPALNQRFGFRFLDSTEDVFRSRQRVELESEVADKKFEIFIGKGDEMNRARQVFSPTFIVWLAEEAHEGVAFELMAGALVVNVKGHKKTAHELDEFCEAAAVVARRLHEEAGE